MAQLRVLGSPALFAVPVAEPCELDFGLSRGTAIRRAIKRELGECGFNRRKYSPVSNQFDAPDFLPTPRCKRITLPTQVASQIAKILTQRSTIF